MTGMNRRSLRHELVAGLVLALAMPALSWAAANPQGVATVITLNAETSYHGPQARTTIDVAVTADDGLAATGAVALEDRGREIAGAALNAQGHAVMQLVLPAGAHSLRAVYSGDTNHRGSTSPVAQAQTEAGTTTTPDFGITAAPATLSLTVGQAGTVIASVTPLNSSGLTAPMFVTLSCSGLPDQSSCTFTPENVEILPNATAALTSSMVIQTQEASTAFARPGTHSGSGIAWAILLPGALGFGGLAWSARRNAWLRRISLLSLVGMVTVLGATGCNPRYNYEHHGPPINPATPAGTYTVMVTAQSSNGVEATTHSTTIALKVK